jgi:hypothetical protein
MRQRRVGYGWRDMQVRFRTPFPAINTQLRRFVRNSLRVFFSVLISANGALGCDSSESEATPVQVLSQFLEAMDQSDDNADALRDAYLLLDKNAHRALEKRALTAQTLSGREFKPWEMLAQGRFRIVFSPAQRGGMKAKIDGNRATVVVRGNEKSQRVEVPMVREKDGWKVELKIPDIQYNIDSPRPQKTK